MAFIADRPTSTLLAAAGGRWAALRRLGSPGPSPRWPNPRGTAPRWPGSRWMLLPVVLPLFLVGGLAAGTLVNLALSGIGLDLGDGEGALLTPASAATTDAGVPVGVCERMEYIVGTACALQQRDHDVEGTR